MAKIVNCTEYLKNKLYKIYKKTLAFTLAEILVVIGIIGIVAALTLPNLNQSTGNKEKIVKVKKIYQNLNHAMGRAQVVYGLSTSCCSPRATFERLTNYMKLSKNCGNSNYITQCMANQAKYGSGNSSVKLYGDGTDSYSAVLADGSAIRIAYGFGGIGNIVIHVDIDGNNKGTDTLGKDIFTFVVSSSTGDITPFGMYDSSCPANTAFCTSWVIENNNMDYLKVDSNGKCKTILNWTTNTSCK